MPSYSTVALVGFAVASALAYISVKTPVWWIFWQLGWLACAAGMLIAFAGRTNDQKLCRCAWRATVCVWLQCLAILPEVVVPRASSVMVALAVCCTWVSLIQLSESIRRAARRAGRPEIGLLWRLASVLLGLTIPSVFAAVRWDLHDDTFPELARIFWFAPLFGLLVAAVVSKVLNRKPIGYCTQCGYDLHGLTSDRCPECGLEVDATPSAGPVGSASGVNRGAILIQGVVLAVMAGGAWLFEPRNGLERIKPTPLVLFDVQRFGQHGDPAWFIPYVEDHRVGRRFLPTEGAGVASEELLRRAEAGELTASQVQAIVDATVASLRDPRQPSWPLCDVTSGLDEMGLLTQQQRLLLWDEQLQCRFIVRDRVRRSGPFGVRLIAEWTPALARVDMSNYWTGEIGLDPVNASIMLESIDLGDRSILTEPIATVGRRDYVGRGYSFDVPLDGAGGPALHVPSDLPPGTTSLRIRATVDLDPEALPSAIMPVDLKTRWERELATTIAVTEDALVEIVRAPHVRDRIALLRPAPERLGSLSGRRTISVQPSLAFRPIRFQNLGCDAMLRMFIEAPTGDRVFAGIMQITPNGASVSLHVVPPERWGDSGFPMTSSELEIVLEAAPDLAETDPEIDRVWVGEPIRMLLYADEGR